MLIYISIIGCKNIIRNVKNPNILLIFGLFIYVQIKYSKSCINIKDKIQVNAEFDTTLKAIDISAMIDEFIDVMEIENKPMVRKYVNELYKGCLK